MLKTKEIKEFKEELFNAQNGICSLCRLELDSDIQKKSLRP